MRIDEVTSTDVDKLVSLFGDLLMICKKELQLDSLPKLKWVTDGSFSKQYHSFGSFQPGENIVTVSLTNRHVIDMMRTLAHELVHYKQMLDGRLGPKSGETGSPIENEANAMAGVIMRKFDHMHPEAFSIKPIMIENVKHNLNKMLGEGQPEPRKPFKPYDPYAPQPVINMQPPDGSIARVGQRLAGKAGPAQNSDPSHWPSNKNGIITPGGQIGTAWKPDPKADNTPYTPYKPDWATNKPDPSWSPEKLRANQSYQDGQVPVDKWKDNEWGGKTSPSGVHANPATLDTSKWVNNQPPRADQGAGQDWPTGTTQQDKSSFLKKEIDPQAVANSAPQPEAPKPAAPVTPTAPAAPEAASDVEKLNELLAEGPPAPPKRPAASAPAAPAPPEDNFISGIGKGIVSAVNPSNWLGSGPDKQLQQNVKNVVQNPNQGNIGNVVGQAIVNNAPGTGNVKNAASAASNTVDAVKNVAKGDLKGAANSAIDAGTNALGAVAPLAGTVAGGAVSLFRNSKPAEPGSYPSDQNEDQAIRELNELLAENIGSTGKLVIFDIDDTLVHTATKINVISNGQVTKELSSHEFTHYKLQPGESFDFGRFRNAKEFFEKSRPIIPMINQLKRDIDTGNKVVMITARADFDDKELFLDTFRKFGIDMGKVHVYRAGNMSNSIAVEEKKAIIIRKLLDSSNYGMAIMYDDSVPNLKGFVKLKREYPGTKFYAWHVSLEGEASELERADELAVF
jgi:hypothetical protein